MGLPSISNIMVDQVFTSPFQEVERRLKYKKVDDTSIAAILLKRFPKENSREREEDLVIAQDIAGAAMLAGGDTAFSSVQTSFLAMAMYPDVQRKAQEELDRVVGSKRLPDSGDREALPYINAVVKESLWWFQIAPLGILHASTEDMEYDGYFIPKDTYMIGNSRSIMHDPKEYCDPREFYPERFLRDGHLNPQVRQPDSAAFGFGRRHSVTTFRLPSRSRFLFGLQKICSGKHFALNSLYSVAASVLAVFDVASPSDSEGHPVKLEAGFTSGLICYPVPFRCTIKPRNGGAGLDCGGV